MVRKTRADGPRRALTRMSSGILGLDTILGGGFFRGGTYIVMGAPGSGKTVTACQAGFAHAAAGERALYVSLLSESHGRLLDNLRSLSFFDEAVIGDRFSFLSGYGILEKEGLTGLIKFLTKTVRASGATLLIMDGVLTASEFAETELGVKKFIHELHVTMDLAGCTTLLLTNSVHPQMRYPEQTMVDGLIELTHETVGVRSVREIEVREFRGGAQVRGRHVFEITSAGTTIYPRIEALPPDEAMHFGRDRLAFGVTSLDAMLNGGVVRGSTTMISGTSGTGKTILGLHFLAAGAARKERGLYLGFHEDTVELAAKAEALRLPFAEYVETGLLELLWEPSAELILDQVADRLLVSARRREVTRLFLDGLGTLVETAIHPDRVSRFFTALMRRLRALGVTAVVSDEIQVLAGPQVDLPGGRLGAGVDNLILVRHVELHSQLYRLLSILKMRSSGFDSAIREFTIGADGIDVSRTFESAEAILTGIGRPSLSGSPSSGRKPRRGRRP